MNCSFKIAVDSHEIGTSEILPRRVLFLLWRTKMRNWLQHNLHAHSAPISSSASLFFISALDATDKYCVLQTVRQSKSFRILGFMTQMYGCRLCEAWNGIGRANKGASFLLCIVCLLFPVSGGHFAVLIMGTHHISNEAENSTWSNDSTKVTDGAKIKKEERQKCSNWHHTAQGTSCKQSQVIN